MEQFAEVADGVWVARHAWLDVNVTAVVGERGVLLVDTLGSDRAATAMLASLRQVTRRPLTAVVNTHAHFDHVLGNAAARQDSPEAGLLAHEDAAAGLADAVAAAMAAPEEHGIDEARLTEVAVSPVVVPEQTFSSVRALDLGDRYVEVVHCGRGHTGGDVVVRVPDADVLVAGDLVEEGASPSYGDDCWPLEWPATLDMVLEMTTADTVVVPGHGARVDRGFVLDQRNDVGMVTQMLYDLAARGAGLEEALAHEDWPFPRRLLEHAVRRGYQHMPRTARRLPLA